MYKPFDKVVWRTPLYPINRVDAESLTDLDARLRREFHNPVFREAIFLASPALLDQYERWIAGEELVAKRLKKLKLSLLKYLLRMSTRCTPFGLFAGCSVGNIAAETQLRLGPLSDYRRHTRLDMNYLCGLAQDIARDPQIRLLLDYFPNSSAYRVSDKLRYVEYTFVNKARLHQIVAVSYSEYLHAILQRAMGGATIPQLSAMIQDDAVSAEEAEAFISELIAAQVLVSDLEPSVTGEEFEHQIIRVLQKCRRRANALPEQAAFIDSLIAFIGKVGHDLHTLDETGAGNGIQGYGRIQQHLGGYPTGFEREFLFQVDLTKPSASAAVSKELVAAIYKGLEIMSALMPESKNDRLAKFAEAFYERYEDREVPLAEALDTETGIGYIQGSGQLGEVAPLVDDLLSPYAVNTDLAEVKWHRKEYGFWMRKYMAALAAGSTVIEISDSDVSGLKPKMQGMADTFSVLASVLHQDVNGDITSPLALIKHAGGSSAANLLGRFCLNDGDIHGLAREIVIREEAFHPERIYAEVTHLPESRVGNILLRPTLRQYEIAYLAKPGTTTECCISIDDLLISVKGSRIVLRSRKLNKEIIPRLSTAHNYATNSLPIYNFLCDLQTQDHWPGIYLDTGVLAELAQYIPRIVYRRIILAPACWNFSSNDLSPLVKASDDQLPIVAEQFRKRFRIPRYIALVEGDNELVLDLENSHCLLLLLSEIKDKNAVRIIEYLLPEGSYCVSDRDGDNYTNEVILSFYRETVPDTTMLPVATRESCGVTRNFFAGDEWLYFKIYTGTKTADLLLRDHISSFARTLVDRWCIDKWFYIRYNDPANHIRVRFHLTDLRHTQTIITGMNTLTTHWFGEGLAWKCQLDTYSREIERYGYERIEHAETVFYHDSHACIRLLETLQGWDNGSYAWLITLRGIREYFDLFRIRDDYRRQVVAGFRSGFAGEFNYDKEMKAQVESKFRENKNAIYEIMEGSPGQEGAAADPLLSIIVARTEGMRHAVQQLVESTSEQERISLLASIIHMSVNRMFRSRQRLHEFMLYCLLEKYYAYRESRAKSKNWAASGAELC
jgi:thiopeptide-type bacteriocin biosynthesis protein